MKQLQRLTEYLLVAGLAGMALMVFGNVVLRYAFASGITFSEEVSRFLFVWITFIGAVLVFAQGGHIAMSTPLSRLPSWAHRSLILMSSLLMLACCALMVWGGWHQTVVNIRNFAPVSGVPRGAIYAVAVFTGLCIGAMLLRNVTRLIQGAPLDSFEHRAETE
ncbi:TRAP transporter small permease (plasmid) [Acidovorax sp. DW039]|uniref:TRAP transporter small permease n=1 Tax=Acidovorax sp. DW039 TaxID=3095606 RepID=UPI003090D1B7|nr:TRAP transporter small permease [Acidovorax sp. DW039]